MRKLVVAIATVGAFAALCAPASAVITSSNITSPSDPVFTDPDTDAGSQPLDLSGTATGTGSVDIWCVYNNGQDSVTGTPLATAPVAGGQFSATIDLNEFDYYLCRLVATDSAAAVPPVNTATFRGPVIGNSGFETYTVGPGPNEGQLFDYFQASSALEGYFSVYSAGDCFVEDSYPVDPATLDYDDALWDCSFVYQGPTMTDSSSTVNGEQLFLPWYPPDPNLPGYRQIEDYTHTIDESNGLMRVSDTEPAMTCVPGPFPTCTSYADAGVELRQKQTGGTAGHTLAINHRWVNTSAETKQLELVYSIETDDGSPGWLFPGDSAYADYNSETTVTPPATGPASIFTAEGAGSPSTQCIDLFDPCGSLTWYDPPDEISVQGDTVVMVFRRTIAAGASDVIALTYSQGFPQANVDGYAAAAEQSFDTTFTFGKLKKNTKKGKATLAVKIPGAGELHLEGKGLRTVDKAVAETASATLAAQTVKLLVKPKGKAKKKLKRKGKAKLKADVTYTRTDLEPTADTKKLKLKQKQPK